MMRRVLDFFRRLRPRRRRRLLIVQVPPRINAELVDTPQLREMEEAIAELDARISRRRAEIIARREGRQWR